MDSPVSPEIHRVQTSAPAFRDVFEHEFDYVWNTLRRLGIRDADLKDLTQEVFLTAYNLLEDFDASRPLRPWLFGIGYRLALRHRALARHTREILGEEGADVIDAAPGPEQAALTKEAWMLVQTALERLELRRRAVFVLHELEGRPIPEIAETLSVPLNTAYSRLRLAREDFAEAVQRLQRKGGVA